MWTCERLALVAARPCAASSLGIGRLTPCMPPAYRDEYYSMGMLHMANAVSFLNNDCKLVGRAAPLPE